MAWSPPTAFTDKFGPGTCRGENLADSLGIASQGAKRHVPVLGRQHHVLDVGHLGGRKLARAGSRARGAVLQTTDRRGGTVPSVISPGFGMDDAQDHGEWEECFCTRDGAQDAGLGGSFGEPLASEGEARSWEDRQENSNHGRKDAHSAIKFRYGVDQLLAVPVSRFDGDDRSRTAAAPSGHGRARDGHVLGQASGTGPDDLERVQKAPEARRRNMTPIMVTRIMASLVAAWNS